MENARNRRIQKRYNKILNVTTRIGQFVILSLILWVVWYKTNNIKTIGVILAVVFISLWLNRWNINRTHKFLINNLKVFADNFDTPISYERENDKHIQIKDPSVWVDSIIQTKRNDIITIEPFTVQHLTTYYKSDYETIHDKTKPATDELFSGIYITGRHVIDSDINLHISTENIITPHKDRGNGHNNVINGNTFDIDGTTFKQTSEQDGIVASEKQLKKILDVVNALNVYINQQEQPFESSIYVCDGDIHLAIRDKLYFEFDQTTGINSISQKVNIKTDLDNDANIIKSHLNFIKQIVKILEERDMSI